MDQKVSLITGASSGVGYAIAQECASHGYTLILAARRQDLLEEIARTFERDYKIRAIPVKTDLTKREDIEHLFRQAEKLGRLDVLVNVAGEFRSISFVDSSLHNFISVYDQTTELMQHAVMYASKRALRLLQKTKGIIINISSDAGLEKKVYPAQVPYHTSKAAVNHMTRAMDLELKEHGMRAFALAPGNIDTPLLRKAIEENKELVKLIQNKEGSLDSFYSKILRPQDIARKVIDIINNPSQYTEPVIEIPSYEF